MCISLPDECDKTADNAVIELISFFFFSLSSDSFPDSFRRSSFCCGVGERDGRDGDDDIWSIIFGRRRRSSGGTPFGGLRSIACCTCRSSVGRSVGRPDSDHGPISLAEKRARAPRHVMFSDKSLTSDRVHSEKWIMPQVVPS